MIVASRRRGRKRPLEVTRSRRSRRQPENHGLQSVIVMHGDYTLRGSKTAVASTTCYSHRGWLRGWRSLLRRPRLNCSGTRRRPASHCYLKLVLAAPGVAIFDLSALAASREDGQRLAALVRSASRCALGDLTHQRLFWAQREIGSVAGAQ